MDPDTVRRLSTLVKLLFAAAALVMVLGAIAAVTVSSAQSSLPGFEEIERESRGPIALGALAAGIAGAGVLAGLGGILRVLLATTPTSSGAPPTSTRPDTGSSSTSGGSERA